jgi:hypothetical protein
MNKKANIDKDALQFLLSRYKKYLLPLTAIVVCIFLLVYVVTPQIQNIQALQNQEKDESQKLAILKSNLNLLYSLDSNTLDKQLRLSSKALPASKDFIGILNGISIVSSKSNTTMGDYGFSVGDITQAPTNVKGIPTLELTITVRGELDNIISLVKELRNTVPLSEIKTINISGNNATLDIVFYYKPLPPVLLKDDMPLHTLSSSVLESINNIATMNNSELENIEELPKARSSTPGAAFSGIQM